MRMNMLKKYLLILFFIVGNSIFSQQNETKKFQLKWHNNINFSINKNFKIKTSLVEGNFIDKNLNPSFSEMWEVAAGVEI